MAMIKCDVPRTGGPSCSETEALAQTILAEMLLKNVALQWKP